MVKYFESPRRVTHCGLAIYVHYKGSLGKRIIMEIQNISPCKNIPNIQKNPLKETKILQDIITL
jgi:hypothetical protein